MILLQQMLALFVFMVIGYAMHKKKISDDRSEGMLSWFIVNIANPCLILSGAVSMEEGMEPQFLGYVFLLSLAMYAGLIILSYPVVALMRVRPDDIGLFRVMMVFSNIGFMGVPLLSALYGSTALIYGAIFGISFNILLYSWGVLMVSRNVKKVEVSSSAGEDLTSGSTGESPVSGELAAEVTAKNGEVSKTPATSPGFLLRKLVNPGTVASVITLIIVLSGVQTPTVVDTIVTNLSNTTVSMSMIVIGASLAKLPIKEVFTSGKLLIFSVLKLLVIPILVLLIVRNYVNDEMLQSVFLIMVSTPVAALSTMLAKENGGNEHVAAGAVAVTTVFSVLTIPFVSFITGVG
ncbi:MAG: AEC family transporter [Eubacterium sp.]|nr:AEC family transporter [Eubacterium sp.]